MNKPSKVDMIVAEICQYIPQVCGVYVFGSRVSGDKHQGSDMDLAILTAGDVKIETMLLWDTQQNLAKMLGEDVDLLDLRQASSVMRMQVIAKGKRLACFDSWVCENFEDFVFVDYARLNEERQLVIADIEKRGLVYG